MAVDNIRFRARARVIGRRHHHVHPVPVVDGATSESATLTRSTIDVCEGGIYDAPAGAWVLANAANDRRRPLLLSTNGISFSSSVEHTDNVAPYGLASHLRRDELAGTFERAPMMVRGGATLQRDARRGGRPRWCGLTRAAKTVGHNDARGHAVGESADGRKWERGLARLGGAR